MYTVDTDAPPDQIVPPAGSRAFMSVSSVRELSTLPLSEGLLAHYRARLVASEGEIRSLEARVDACADSQADQYKSRWETLKRMDEITDLQKALSDSHVLLWEEREKCVRLNAENDELKVQEVEDRRKIQQLLSVVNPTVQDTMYVRNASPETVTLHPHARSITATAAHGSGAGDGASIAHSGSDSASARTAGVNLKGTRVLRTVYLPNEQVNSLLLTIEALRTQLQQQELLSRERIAALLEDRRIRIAEERARRASESEHAKEAEVKLERTQKLLQQYAKDFLALKHASLVEQRTLIEQLETSRIEIKELRERVDNVSSHAELKVHMANSSARAGAEQYVALYRQQVSDSERTMGLLRDQHSGLQQALALRVQELEAMVTRLKNNYKALEKRRGFEVEGFTQEIHLMRKNVRRLEVLAYGRQVVPGPSAEVQPFVDDGNAVSAKVTHGARAFQAMQVRISALEKSLRASDANAHEKD